MAAGWLWEPKEQLTHVETPELGASTPSWARGHTSQLRLHLLQRVWDVQGVNSALAYYMRMAAPWETTGAWTGRELVTDTTLGHRTTDLNIAADANDSVYIAMEVFNWSPVPPQPLGDPLEPRIGFRRRGESWGAVHIISPDSVNLGFDSPNIALQHGADDTLHVMFRRRTSEPPAKGIWHTRKAVAAADDAWEPATFVTGTIGRQWAGSSFFAVESRGVVHFFGREKTVGDDPKIRQWHFWGYPPGAGSWDVDSVQVAEYTVPLIGQSIDEDPSEVNGVSTIAGVFHWAWAVPLADGAKAIFYSRGDSAGHWLQSPMQLTASDGIADAPEVFARTNQDVHVLYHEGGDPLLSEPPPAVRLMHIRTTDGGSTWSRPTDVSAGARTVAFRPQGLAEADTLFLMLTSHDDDDPTPGSDGDYEVWLQKGYAIADTLGSANVTWAGAVYLDSDFEIQPGKTLTIAPGTTVYLLASPEPDQVDILVNGALMAVGTAAEPITFVPYDPTTGASTWGSIVFAPGADGSSSRLEHVVIRDAAAGLRCAGTAPSLRDVTFESNTLAEIVLEGDTRIETGSEWILDAPLRVMALETPASEDTLGTDGYTDLIVPGLLETASSAAPDTVYFTSFAKDAANGDDWGGITVPSGGRGLLRNCDIGYALRGVYFADADSAVLVDSRVHHYSQEGVFDFRSDARIEECTIVRGADLLADTTTTAIHAKASVAKIHGNTIGWQNAYGIWVDFAKTTCADLPWGPPDTLWIVENEVTGDGTSDRPGSAAIRGEYLCTNLVTVVDNNEVTNWRGRAIDLHETADVHVTCNTFDGNFAGGQYYGQNALQTNEEDVFWKQNSLKQNTSDNLKVLYETRLRFYDDAGSGAAAGQNALRLAGGGTSRNIRIAGGSLDVTVDARFQTWYNAAGNLLTEGIAIQATNEHGPGSILVAPPLTSEQLCDQGSMASPGALAGAAALDSERGGTTDTVNPQVRVPDRWALAMSGQNPAMREVDCTLAVPSPAPVRVAVYDVRGRRVRTLHDGTLGAGYHRIRWDRFVEGGGPAAVGVYFLRVDAPDFRETRKVVLLAPVR